MNLIALRRSVMSWYRRNARDLPWRRTKDPYAILVSEIMLQQTQVERVVPKFAEFMRRFPTVRALSEAELSDVLRVWSGLGYNGRARRLWECARTLASEHGSALPAERHRLEALPGIGPYTAGAVASIAFGAPEACVDTNVRRVLSRSLDGTHRGDLARAWTLAHRVLPRAASGDWNQALMELGAVVCKPVPRCGVCPIRRQCKAAASGHSRGYARPPLKAAAGGYHGSRRFYRGRVVKALTQAPALSFMLLGREVKPGFEKTDLPWLRGLLADLEKDGLVTVDRRRARARLG